MQGTECVKSGIRLTSTRSSVAQSTHLPLLGLPADFLRVAGRLGSRYTREGGFTRFICERMAASSATTPSSTAVRRWRTAFLTLRDETLTRSPKSIGELLCSLVFSHTHSLLSAASQLPPHEVTSDLLFLLELVANSSQQGHELAQMFSHTAQLLHDICQRQRVSIQLSPSSWTLVLNSFVTMLQFFLGKAGPAPIFTSNAANVRPAIECMETLRYLVSVYQQKSSLPDDIQLVRFLLRIIDCSRSHLVSSSSASSDERSAAVTGKRLSKYSSLWEVYTVAFNMLGEALARIGASLPFDVWQCTVEGLRKLMDELASKTSLVEDTVMSRFYASLLNCLHTVLVDPKGSLLEHVSGFVSTLRMFLTYGLNSRPQVAFSTSTHKKELYVASPKLTPEESKGGKYHGPYRPPHLRKDSLSKRQSIDHDSACLSDREPSVIDFSSSDSDYSDSDSSGKDTDSIQSFKVRVAAIGCIQDLCQADPKSFTTQWTMLLPTNDVLQPRKFESTLMTCLLFDPYFKARMASASTLAVMLDGPSSSVFLQVAEYKESTKLGSYMALSSSLGRILMQLHTGILHLIQRETHSRLLGALFKILMLLTSSTPYSRMPGELLPTVITSLVMRAENGFPFKSDQTGLLSTTISCLTAALSTSPSSSQVKQMLLQEISTGIYMKPSSGVVEAEKKSGILSTIFQHSEQVTSPTICFEALQAVRAVAHHYPSIMMGCWENVAGIVSKILGAAALEVPTRTSLKGSVVDNIGFIGEKVITAAIKVLDECLRAISGFKGTEDLFDDKLLDAPFVSDCMRNKKVSSAPSFEPETMEDTKKEEEACLAGSEHWSKAIEKHMPTILSHSSSMVRTASVTCFAGITLAVFSSLTKDKQEFVVSSLVNGAVHDGAPSVRSAACRAIGVVSCFPQISQSAEILGKFIHAIEVNTHDPLVRITASWALANTCDSLRHCADDFLLKSSSDSNANSQLVAFVTECALRLTKDGDKIKSNAVRALGNLSRFVRYTRNLSVVHDKPVEYLDSSTNKKLLAASSNLLYGHGHSSNSCCTAATDATVLDRMVQAFISCVTTGNVKVQWNVCHALSNLFLNETLRLQNMDWAPSLFSILLLLLRDSCNFKIRIQAAAALAAPASALDYGKSFSDVVLGLEHTLENLGTDQILGPSSFKYRIALEKQVTATMLHVLSLVSGTDHQALKDFLVKKSQFLEEWFKALCTSLGDASGQPDTENFVTNQKKEMISKALQSLVKVYESRNLHMVVQKFEKLDNIVK
ncbi:hypothetical protein Tsubulata_027630 [Turnera subulata]|uniref:DUF4042 domain-containing protein n=1 Tax=Turnera subulata TaxID=218843 RepID=A0A9Q0JFC2_9ROSI|nr:hypothetical protein Tsubulata_027630 [Turnera subulata]